MKLPSMQFYPGDWMKDPALRSVSFSARGLWMDMLCLMFESSPRGHLQHKTGKPITPEQLCRMTGGTLHEVEKSLQELEESGVFSKTKEGIVFSRRIVKDEKTRKVRAKAGREGGEANGKQNQSKSEAKPKQNDKQKTPPSSSSSSSSSSSKKSTARILGEDPPDKKPEEQPPAQPGSPPPYAFRTDDISSLIYVYKIIKGFQDNDREWDERQWARNVNPAKEILKIWKGDRNKAIDYMNEFAKAYTENNLEFTFETMAKKYDDWRVRGQKDAYAI